MGGHAIRKDRRLVSHDEVFARLRADGWQFNFRAAAGRGILSVPDGGIHVAEPTLAEVVKRLEALERQFAEQTAAKQPRKKDWRRVVGMFDADPEFMQQVIAEGQAIREAERQAARAGTEQ